MAGLAGAPLAELHGAASVDGALSALACADPGLAQRLQARIAAAVEQRSGAYLARYGQTAMQLGAVLFDRQRQVCGCGPLGRQLLERFQARDLG